MSTPVLQVQGISKRFGGLQALSDVGMTIQAGQVYGLIGPNGAGKTTFFNVITGLYTPDSGNFMLAGTPYQPTAVHEVALGLAEAGAISKRRLRDFDALCLTPMEPFSPEEIRALRLRENASQAVFALHLNVTTGLVRQWERGEK
jgi:DNA-binding transcriptional regulator YiaG